MEKGVGIRILQKPIVVVFDCPYCEEEIEISYEEFEKITNADLGEIFNDSPSFNCPKCNEKLYIDEVDLD